MTEGKVVVEEVAAQKTLEDFGPQKKPKRNKYAFACAMLASMTSILLGYDIGVMSGAAIYIKRDLKLSDGKVEVMLGIINIYSLIGSCLAGRTSDWIGRRYTIVFAGAIFFAGALLMGFSPNYAFLMFGRFVAGVGIGYALMIAPVYTAEVSPASSRGFLTSFPEVFINAGILLGYISNFAFSKMSLRIGWRMMLGVGAIPSVILAVGVLAMPESPRWLVMRGRLGEATKVLNKTSDSKEEAQLRLADIKRAAGIPEDNTDDIVQVPKRNTGDGVWKELFLHPTPVVRHIVIAAIGIHFFQQASGIDAVVLYSPEIFKEAGIKGDTDQLLATIAVGVVKTLFILVATFLLDRVGRRPLLLTSVGGMVLSLLTLGVSLTIIDHSDTKVTWAVVLSIAMVLSYVATFSIGAGPITWVYSSEIFPLRLRAQGAAAGVVVNRVTSGIISMTFLSLKEGITIGGAFFLFGGIATTAWIFFYIMLPETQGKTLEEMGASFGKIWRKSDANSTTNKGQTRLAHFGVVSSEWLLQAEAATTNPLPPSPDTHSSKETNFSVINEFNKWRKHPDLAEAVAAIRSLAAVISSSNASTMMQLEIELKNASDSLKSWDTTSISLTAACDLFMRYVTRTSALEYENFNAAKSRLIERADKFGEISYKARKIIGGLCQDFIIDGCTILVHGFSRVVLEALKMASQNKKQFQVLCTEGRPDRTGLRLSRELANLDVPVKLVIDSAVAYTMDEVDMVFVGADGVVESGGIINMMGTYQIALVAKSMNKPVYVAAESYKFARLYPLDQKDMAPAIRPVDFGVPIPSKVEVECSARDYTPPQYLTLLFTDLGVLTPSVVSDELIQLYL